MGFSMLVGIQALTDGGASLYGSGYGDIPSAYSGGTTSPLNSSAAADSGTAQGVTTSGAKGPRFMAAPKTSSGAVFSGK